MSTQQYIVAFYVLYRESIKSIKMTIDNFIASRSTSFLNDEYEYKLNKKCSNNTTYKECKELSFGSREYQSENQHEGIRKQQ